MYKKWKKMQEEGGAFLYREGTLDQSTFQLYHRPDADKQHHSSTALSSCSLVLRQDWGAKSNTSPPDCVVVLKDIVAV